MSSVIPDKKPDTHSRVLIFEDDADLLEVCSIVLRSKDFDVLGRNKCTEIMDDIDNYKPHVILMDNWIPDQGGVIATQLLKNNNVLKRIPVIFFSANSNIEQLAREAGADYFLQKPFEINELEELVTTAIRKTSTE